MRPSDKEPCEPRAVPSLAGRALGPDLDKALHGVGRLRGDLDRVERLQVASALDQGWSWARIGCAPGVTRQAVHHKYRGRRPEVPRPAAEHRPRLASRTRLAVLIGRTEAASRGDALAGTEHLLAGILQQGEGGAAELLEELGVTVAALRGALDALTPSGVSQQSPSSLPLSRRARQALALAAAYAARGRAAEASDVHLLRALVADPSANAVHVLRALGVEREDVIAALAPPCERDGGIASEYPSTT